MTTPAAANLYLAQYLLEMEGKGWAVYNPKDKPLEELTIIFGFFNGGSGDWLHGGLIAENGVGLGGHVCSHESYMPGDLGVLEGTRADRHELFQSMYPEGYMMAWVSSSEVKGHPGIDAAVDANQATDGKGTWPFKGNLKPEVAEADAA
jgi:hypothetical protein